jgi:AraC-like DNA-binding protein
MQFKKYIPAYPLSNYIQHILYVNGAIPIPYLKELPDGGINLVVELENTINTVFTENNSSGKYSLKNSWISGTQRQAITYVNNPNSTILSIRFTTGGFFALTKIPVSAITHTCMETDLLLGNSFKNLYQRIINAGNVEAIVKVIEAYFLQQIPDNDFESSVVKFIDKNLDKPIDWLINKSGYSQKHVISLTKKFTGFSPKYLQRLNRFQKVVKEIKASKTKIEWASMAYQFDYFDQAHFIKEFIHFSGMSPVEYLSSQLAIEHNHLVGDIILLPPSYKNTLVI